MSASGAGRCWCRLSIQMVPLLVQAGWAARPPPRSPLACVSPCALPLPFCGGPPTSTAAGLAALSVHQNIPPSSGCWRAGAPLLPPTPAPHLLPPQGFRSLGSTNGHERRDIATFLPDPTGNSSSTVLQVTYAAG